MNLPASLSLSLLPPPLTHSLSLSPSPLPLTLSTSHPVLLSLPRRARLRHRAWTRSQGTDCTLQRSHGLGCAFVTCTQYCSSSPSLVSSNQLLHHHHHHHHPQQPQSLCAQAIQQAADNSVITTNEQMKEQACAAFSLRVERPVDVEGLCQGRVRRLTRCTVGRGQRGSQM